MKENLKVLMINGSPKANGNTAVALKEMENIFKENGICLLYTSPSPRD